MVSGHRISVLLGVRDEHRCSRRLGLALLLANWEQEGPSSIATAVVSCALIHPSGTAAACWCMQSCQHDHSCFAASKSLLPWGNSAAAVSSANMTDRKANKTI